MPCGSGKGSATAGSKSHYNAQKRTTSYFKNPRPYPRLNKDNQFFILRIKCPTPPRRNTWDKWDTWDRWDKIETSSGGINTPMNAGFMSVAKRFRTLIDLFILKRLPGSDTTGPGFYFMNLPSQCHQVMTDLNHIHVIGYFSGNIIHEFPYFQNL